VDNALSVQEMDAVEQLEDESSDEVEGEAVVSVAFDELIEVHGHERECHALSNVRLTIRCLKGKYSLSYMQFLEERGSLLLIRFRIRISILAWLRYFSLFLTILRATAARPCLWSMHLNTCPNDPSPSSSTS